MIQREYYANGLLKKEVQIHTGSITSTHQYEYDRLGRRTKYRMGNTEQDVINYIYPAGDSIVKMTVSATQWKLMRFRVWP